MAVEKIYMTLNGGLPYKKAGSEQLRKLPSTRKVLVHLHRSHGEWVDESGSICHAHRKHIFDAPRFRP